MSPRFILGRENVPCVAEVLNRSLKADCTDFTCPSVCGLLQALQWGDGAFPPFVKVCIICWCIVHILDTEIVDVFW